MSRKNAIFNHLVVESELESFRQSLVGFLVESDLMGNMGKINLLCTDTASHMDGIIDELMAMVRLVETQGIDN